MTAFPDHYAALGIDPTADQEVIAAAYRALAKKYHPDTGATKGTASPERFSEIQQAYEVLGSAESRRRYDQDLLDATQRELDEHLAAKQRKLAGAAGAPPPQPDLGVIRPERRGGNAAPWYSRASLKEMGPFLVVSVLLMVVVGGFASLFLAAPVPSLEEPSPPQVQSSDAPAKPAPAAKRVTPANSEPETDAKAARVDAESRKNPVPDKYAKAVTPLDPQLPAGEKPLFGSSLTDEAAATLPLPSPVDDIDEPLPLPAVPSVKPRPQPAPAKRTAAVESGAARYTPVIYEKYRGGEPVAEEAGVQFTSEDRCEEFGEKVVLRRLAPYEGQQLRPRIWYECQQTP